MPNYSNGKIYKIVCDTTNKVYIGSTTLSLCKRLAQHKRDFNLYKDGKKRFSSSYDLIENENYKIVLLEHVKCNNREELLQRERFYIENKECVNRLIPIRGKEEKKELDRIVKRKYDEDHKESIKQRKQNYYQQNKEHILGRCKNYRENGRDNKKINCECGSSIVHYNLHQHVKSLKHINFMNNNNNNI